MINPCLNGAYGFFLDPSIAQNVQVSKANFIHAWFQVPQMQIQRLGEGLWQSKAIDLEREADYHVLPSAEQTSHNFT